MSIVCRLGVELSSCRPAVFTRSIILPRIPRYFAMSNYQNSLTNHDAGVYAKHGSFSYDPKFCSPVLELLQARKGERVIDLGCGTGEITLQIAQALGPEGKVYGVDSSESMVSSFTDD